MPAKSTAAVSLAAVLLVCLGCGEPSLDSPEYGEIIYEVPARLNQPYPLPELERAATAPAPAPQSSGETSGTAESDSK